MSAATVVAVALLLGAALALREVAMQRRRKRWRDERAWTQSTIETSVAAILAVRDEEERRRREEIEQLDKIWRES